MFTLIILVVVLAFIIGALKEMSATERSIVIRRTLNMCTFGTIYIFRALKALFRASYHSGEIAGLTLAIEGQDTLDSMNKHNIEVTEKGGAMEMAIRSSQDHASKLGLSDVNHNLKSKAEILRAQLKIKREALAATVPAV